MSSIFYTSLIERNLKVQSEDAASKKKYQTANWMRRPIPPAQIEYALSDVKYLFDLKESLLSEMASKLTKSQQGRVMHDIKVCAALITRFFSTRVSGKKSFFA